MNIRVQDAVRKDGIDGGRVGMQDSVRLANFCTFRIYNHDAKAMFRLPGNRGLLR